MQAEHVTDITDLTRMVPNISFTAASGNGGAGPGTSNIEIRGISSAAGAATVGIYLGEVSITVGNVYTMGSVEPMFFDIDRIEVLRGPQATLYGASSMGGTIKFVPNEPDLKEREVSTYAEASNTRGGSANYAGNVVGNFPLIPGELALRIGAQAQHAGGYINQVDAEGNVIARNINQVDDQELRVALKWKLTPALTITPSLYYQVVDAKDISAFNLELPAYQAQKQVREPSRDKLLTPSVTLNWDLGKAELTSSTSYFQRKFDRTQNGSAYNSFSLSTFLTSTDDGGNAPPELIDAIACARCRKRSGWPPGPTTRRYRHGLGWAACMCRASAPASSRTIRFLASTRPSRTLALAQKTRTSCPIRFRVRSRAITRFRAPLTIAKNRPRCSAN